MKDEQITVKDTNNVPVEDYKGDFHTVEQPPNYVPDKTFLFHDNLTESGIFLRATTSVPTDIPVNPLDKLRLYVSGTTTSTVALYIYDTLNGQWRTPASSASGGWEKLGETTLSIDSGNITVDNLPQRKNIRVNVCILGATSNMSYWVDFNSDYGATRSYGTRAAIDDGADSIVDGDTQMLISNVDVTYPVFSTIDIMQPSTAYPKMITSHSVIGSGGSTATRRHLNFATWNNTTDAITQIRVMKTQTGNILAGSWVTVYGSND